VHLSTYGIFIYVDGILIYMHPVVRDIFIYVHPLSYDTHIYLHLAIYGEFIYVNSIFIYMHPVIRGRFIYVHPVMYIYSYSNNSLIETKYRVFYLKTTLTFMVYCFHSVRLFVVVLWVGFSKPHITAL
jgi:hypothetical protein